MEHVEVPTSVLAAYGLEASVLEPILTGHINLTWLATHSRGRFILQCVAPIFSAEIHYNIAAVTRRLADHGLLTPRLVSTKDSRLWTRDAEGHVWRVLTFVPGEIHTRANSPAMCKSAGALVARFHRAVYELEHTYVGKRPGVHDTRQHLTRLRDSLKAQSEHRNFKTIERAGNAILTHAADLPPLNGLPLRHVHGDLKLSNVVFSAAGEALTLIDLDTLGQMPLPVELGDAWRSWCNTSEEDSPDSRFDAELFSAAVEGYSSQANQVMGPEELKLLVPAVETIAIELAARFCRDALEEDYFAWDKGRYPSASEHNLTRAKSQLRLAESIRSQRRELEGVIVKAFALSES